MNGLADFRVYFSAFLSLVAAGVVSTSLVLVAAVVGLAPPWPTAIVQITAVAQLIVLAFVYQNYSRAGRKATSSKMKSSLVVLILFFTTYLGAHSLLVFSMPNGETSIRGIECSTNATLLYGDSCPFLEEVQIADAEYEDDRLWTPVGLMISRLVLLVGWVVQFSALVTFLAIFVVFQRRQPTP